MTREEVDAALCVWEAMLASKSRNPALRAAFAAHGYAAMRGLAPELGVKIEAAWCALTEDQQDDAGAFDWEFVPAQLKGHVW
jgi:hypothetical protein